MYGKPGSFNVVRCIGCELMRTNPRPNYASINQFYPHEYLPHHSSSPDYFDQERGGTLRRLLLRWFGTNNRELPLTQPGRAVEIGCANGDWLRSLAQKGWIGQGIEFSEEAAALARAEGLNVHCAMVENAPPPHEPVDLIAAWMVLEHLHDPLQCLAILRSWSKPSTFLVGSVPDASSLHWRYFREGAYDLQLPTHLFHYTPTTLRKVLLAGGWQVKRIRWQRNANSPLLSLEHALIDAGQTKSAKTINWLRTSPRARPARQLLHWLSGNFKQSGRMEFWATPVEIRE